jgi:flagellar motor switch protein FliN/FliY
MSEEENLPSAEEMRARYADLTNDDAAPADESTVDSPQSAEGSAVDSPQSAESEPEAKAAPDPAEDLAAHLLDVNVRFWAELGRSQLPLAQAVALGAGAIVDLDKEPEDEVDIYVNGMPFATGRLLLVDEEWAIRLERIVAIPQAVEQASSSGSGA